MFTTVTADIAAEHRIDLIEAAGARRARLVADSVASGSQESSPRSGHRRLRLIGLRAWLAAGQL